MDAEKVTVIASDEFTILEPEQVAAVARAATDPTMAALFEVAAFTGAAMPRRAARAAMGADRLREPDRARRAQLDPRRGDQHEGQAAAQRAAVRPGARGARPLSRREHFDEPGDLVFCTDLRRSPAGRRDPRRLLRGARCRRAGAPAREEPDPIIPYDLRHTFGSLAVRKAPLSDVQAWMGHQTSAPRCVTSTTSRSTTRPRD